MIQVRPVQLPADYPRLAELLNLINTEPVTADELAGNDRKIPTHDIPSHDEAGRQTGFMRPRFMAVDETGHAVGYGEAWRAPWTTPGNAVITVVVDPACRGRGAGTLLTQTAEAAARAKGCTVLITEIRDDLPDSVRFAQKHGYTLDRHLFESTLDLSTFNAAPFADVVPAVEAGGLRFYTLADAPGEATERIVYDLEKQTSHDIPGFEGDFWPYAEWHKWTVTADLVPDCTIIAADGDRPVGVTVTHRRPQTGAMYTLHTGVLPAYRGRKVALALKLLAIQAAHRHGAPYMRTNNDSKNAPMLAVNRKLGYTPAPGTYRFRKQA
jgi:GNAT superfamily N-acetyltransferase